MNAKISVALSFLITCNAWADSATVNKLTGLGMSSELSSYIGNSTIVGGVQRIGGDTNRRITFSAANDTAIKMTFGDGGTTAAQTFSIGASTADTDDDSKLCLVGGGGGCATDNSRGAYLFLSGNEETTVGDITLATGNGTAAKIDINAGAAAGVVNINTGTGLTNAASFDANQLTTLGGRLAFSTALSTITAGATSIQFNNNANNNANLTIADAGAITFRGTLIGTGTSTLGWAVVAGANTACTTTCVTPCVFGVNTAATEADIVDCADATADKCLCAGAT